MTRLRKLCVSEKQRDHEASKDSRSVVGVRSHVV